MLKYVKQIWCKKLFLCCRETHQKKKEEEHSSVSAVHNVTLVKQSVVSSSSSTVASWMFGGYTRIEKISKNLMPDFITLKAYVSLMLLLSSIF